MALHSALMQDVGWSLLWKQHIMTSHSSLHLLMATGSYFRDIKAENLTQDHKWNWNFTQGPDYKILLLEKRGMQISEGNACQDGWILSAAPDWFAEWNQATSSSSLWFLKASAEFHMSAIITIIWGRCYTEINWDLFSLVSVQPQHFSLGWQWETFTILREKEEK